MTTIAYKNGVMASDSCWDYNDLQEVSATKIKRLSSGALIGLSGDNDARDVYALFDKVKNEKHLPTRVQLATLRGSFGGVLVLPNGRVYRFNTQFEEKDRKEDFGIWETNRGCTACGSGAEVAIGAMSAGKTANEAVAIACRWDKNSRAPVHLLRLHPAASKNKSPPKPRTPKQ